MGTQAALLTTPQAAEFLGLSPRTLDAWRCRKSDGPRFVKLGHRVCYRPADLEVWIETNLRRSTSDPGPEAA